MTLQEQALLELIVREWKSLPPPLAPQSVWIRGCAPVLLNAEGISIQAFPQAVWFLDRQGLRPESVWKWLRFVTVQCVQPWCSTIPKEPIAIFGKPHEIGLAAFARYVEGNRFYVETMWGSTFGLGSQVLLGQSGQAHRERRIWVS